jgi:hypothetical protein
MTTNKSFGRWAEILSDEAIASATLDRLLHHAHIYSLQGDSYRMKDRLKAGVVDFFLMPKTGKTISAKSGKVISVLTGIHG